MKIGIMQPYFMPYIGYWQLINAVDKFVLLDDVNYIMRGYINRNHILLNGRLYRFTIPIEKASQNKLICETKLNFPKSKKHDLLKTVCSAYKKAPYYEQVMPLIEDIINSEETDLTKFIWYSIEKIAGYLHIYTQVSISSQLDKNQDLKAEARIIEICERLGADIYINPCGGRSLYCRSHFEQKGIKLFFLDTKKENIIYQQYQNEFVQNLSIIDVLMFNSVQAIKIFLDEYILNI